MTNDRSGLVPDRKAVTGGFSASVDFASSVLAGLVIGLGLDWLFGTRPVFIVLFVVAGFIAGFYKLWRTSAVLEEMAEERRRGL
ncbi:MAG: AtpZ/AtpI family protein [Acidimicrobiia bacterium]|nr:AtpZ/AtpI family protein [Acidimicrobiia bacterium]